METKKALAFIQKIIDQSKTNNLKWKTANESKCDFPFYETAYTYTAKTKQGTLILAKSSYDSTDCQLFIVPTSGVSYDFSDLISWYDENAKRVYLQSIRELYDFVYNSLPNVDSFVNSFLKE